MTRALVVIQILSAMWLLFWACVYAYHMWIADLILRPSNTHDTYYVVYHFGHLGISIYGAVAAFLITTIIRLISLKSEA